MGKVPRERLATRKRILPITKTEAVAVLNRFIDFVLNKEEWYQKCLPNIEAMLLYGSVAHQTNRANSDIDLAIFMPLKLEELYTKSEYFYSFEDYEINIVIKSTENLQRQIIDGINNHDKHVFQDAIVMYSKDTNLTNEIITLGK
jgi:predicted nucleotidyltransferase